jgi:hypothetical protein
LNRRRGEMTGLKRRRKTNEIVRMDGAQLEGPMKEEEERNWE